MTAKRGEIKTNNDNVLIKKKKKPIIPSYVEAIQVRYTITIEILTLHIYLFIACMYSITIECCTTGELQLY